MDRAHSTHRKTAAALAARLTLFLILLLVSIVPAAPGYARPPADELVTQALTRTLSFPANALNFDKTSTVITQSAAGLTWQSNFASPAYLILPRPADWDGSSDVQLRLNFFQKTAGSGDVQFFIRPRGYDAGDTFADASSLSGDPAPVGGVNVIQEQLITIPAARFGAKSLWVITIQRKGSSETFAGDIILQAVSLTYGALAGGQGVYALPANALNYDKASAVITQFATGLQWQASFASPAYLTIPRPADWDGFNDLKLHLFFYSKTAGSGDVQFFIRPRAFDPGDTFADASSLSGDPAAISGMSQVGEQVITIPAARFGNKRLWVVTLQRQGSLETFSGEVVLLAVGLSYPRLSGGSYATGLPANALNYDQASAVISQSAAGLQWQPSFASGAFLSLHRPADWDGTSDVQLRLQFMAKSAGSGDVQFFIRPRAYNPGDTFADVSSLSGDPVPISAANQIGEQVITIPAARFGSKSLWVITLQRQGSLETYPGELVLLSVGLVYQPATWYIYLPLVLKDYVAP